MKRFPLGLLFIMIGASLSGCLTTEAGPSATSPTTQEPIPTDDFVEPGTPGKNQTESRVKVDPNATFQGSAHKHDWWGTDTEVRILDKDIPLAPGGVCVGELTFACAGAPEGGKFIRFESDPDPNTRPNIVFPGAGKMEIRVTVGQVVQPFVVAVSGPGGFTWAKNRLVVDAPSKTFTLDLVEANTDPPHFRTSGYVFRLEQTGTRSLWTGPMHVIVTISKDLNRDLPLDPPHPDFWVNKTNKVLFEGKQAVASCLRTPAAISGACGSVPEFPPNNTITIGAGKLVIDMTWANSEPYPSKLGLEYCAPGAIACWSTGAEYIPAPMTQDGTNKRTFTIEVRPDQWDSPYVKTSAWDFHWRFDGPDGQNWGSMKGTIDWKFELFKQV
ncbi:MAG: hypothetical protein HYT80_07285 [Euryarchaeota archaeon]|nr:hypothetical protein [Euryarchaeota archaeon]